METYTGSQLPINPDKNQARQTALMAHAVLTKFKEMGLPDEYDDELAAVCTDLGDLWSAEKLLNKQLQALIGDSADWANVGDVLIDLKSTINHITWHIRSAIGPIEKLAMFAYGKSEDVV